MKSLNLQVNLLDRNAQAALSQLTAASKQTDQAFRGMAQGQNQVQTELQQTSAQLRGTSAQLKAFNTNTSLVGNTFSAAFRGMGGVLSTTGSQIVNMTKSMAKFATTSATVAGALAVGKLTSEFIGFESGMSKVQAKLRLNKEDMGALTTEAKRLGATTMFTAEQVSQGMDYLAMAGYKQQDILKSTEGVMQLAAAAGVDVGTSADIASNLLSAFGMSADQTGDVVDTLAVGVTSANMNLTELAEAMKWIAPTSRILGVSMEETTAMIGTLADFGLKGGIATRTLNERIGSLADTSKGAGKDLKNLGVTIFDNEGKFKGYKSMIEQIAEKTKDMDDQTKVSTLKNIFGDAQKAVANLTSPDGIDKINDKLGQLNDKQGAGAQMMETMTDNLKGDLLLLWSAISGQGQKMGESFSGSLRKAVQDLTAWINSPDSAAFFETIRNTITQIGSITKAAFSALQTLFNSPPVQFLRKLIEGNPIIGLTASLIGFNALKAAIMGLSGMFVKGLTTKLTKDMAVSAAGQAIGKGFLGSLGGGAAAAGIAGWATIFVSGVAALGLGYMIGKQMFSAWKEKREQAEADERLTAVSAKSDQTDTMVKAMSGTTVGMDALSELAGLQKEIEQGFTLKGDVADEIRKATAEALIASGKAAPEGMDKDLWDTLLAQAAGRENYDSSPLRGINMQDRENFENMMRTATGMGTQSTLDGEGLNVLPMKLKEALGEEGAQKFAQVLSGELKKSAESDFWGKTLNMGSARDVASSATSAEELLMTMNMMRAADASGFKSVEQATGLGTARDQFFKAYGEGDMEGAQAAMMSMQNLSKGTKYESLVAGGFEGASTSKELMEYLKNSYEQEQESTSEITKSIDDMGEKVAKAATETKPPVVNMYPVFNVTPSGEVEKVSEIKGTSPAGSLGDTQEANTFTKNQ